MIFKDDFEVEKMELQSETSVVADGDDANCPVNAASGSNQASASPISKLVASSPGRDAVISPSEDAPKTVVSGRTKKIRLVLFGMFAVLLFSINYIVITTALGAWKCSLKKHQSAPVSEVKKQAK
ncbi:MAG: hypothetical protein K2W95_13560 [Candidatus Obscuribacterales bacterium]|nr:hypothetical protein [Candidatus Obscuribacterales bacterium]